jgi:hypothetical protein
MTQSADSSWSIFLAISVFIVTVAVWSFIPPAIIRNAWLAERAEMHVITSKAEDAIYDRIFDNLQTLLARNFRGYIRDAEAMGQGELGNQAFSRWAQDRIMATWLWIGLIVYRLQVLMGWLLPGIPFMAATYLDGHYVREIRKYSFVAQSPIRHKLAVRLTWVVLAGFLGWVMIPVAMPLLMAPVLIVLISCSLWLWVSNLQKRL